MLDPVSKFQVMGRISKQCYSNLGANTSDSKFYAIKYWTILAIPFDLL